MGKINLIIGLLLGWLLAAIVPHPRWISKRVDSIFHAGKERANERIEERKEKFADELREKIEDKADELEDKID
ncbi:MAG: hypothetical protein AABZ44_10280 [Elusimicrobiota bacterium]